jgi:hypothetical protein
MKENIRIIYFEASDYLFTQSSTGKVGKIEMKAMTLFCLVPNCNCGAQLPVYEKEKLRISDKVCFYR